MGPERVMGLILLSFGVVVVVAGLVTARAMAGEVGGSASVQSMQPVNWYWVGAVSMTLGILMVWFGKRGTKA